MGSFRRKIKWKQNIIDKILNIEKKDNADVVNA
jgi:hypothetical protein